MISCIFERFGFLQNMAHAKSLLLIHGPQSFSEYFNNCFITKGKDKPLGAFVKNIKETEEYIDVVNYMEETKANANHPKLRKLSEILESFFLDESHKNSKAIVFSQFRESANEIKRYLEKKNPDTVKSEVFVG